MRDLTVHIKTPARLYGFYLAEDINIIRALTKEGNTIKAPEESFKFRKRASWKLRPRMVTPDMVAHLLTRINNLLPKEEYTGALLVMFSEMGYVVMGTDVNTYLVSEDLSNVTVINEIKLTYT
jgi:hypothetical protein